MAPGNPRRFDVVRHRVRGMKAPYLLVLQHHDVPSMTRLAAPLTPPLPGDYDGVAPPVDVDGVAYRARLLDMAAYPRSVLLETVDAADQSADAITHALDVIFSGYPIDRP
jgi:hypothetical protein